MPQPPVTANSLETALSHIPDFTYTFDLNGRFTYVNQALLSLWRKPLSEALGKNFFDLGYTPDLADRLQRQIQQVIDTGRGIRDETPYAPPDASVGYYEYIFVPVFAPDGSVEGVAGSTRDITFRKKAEAALRDSEERFSAAFAQAPVGMVITTPEGKFVEANQAYLNMLGYTREELAARDSDGFTHPDDVAATHDYGEAFRTGRQQTSVLEKRYIRKNGQTIWACASGTMLRDGDGNPTQFIAIIEDVTERKRIEQALHDSEQRQRVLLELMQGQRKTSDPHIMMQAAAEAAGRYLQAERVGFFEMQGDDTLSFLSGWSAGRLPLLDSPFPAIGIGTRYLELVRNGRVLGITDARTDPLTADSRFAEMGAVALIGVPIIRGGRWHAGFYVHHGDPRTWVDDEIVFARDIAEQTWDAVERARAEAALRTSEEQLRIERERLAQVFAQAPAAVCVLRGRDLVFELVNPHYQQLFPGRILEGKPLLEALPEVKEELLEILRDVLDTGLPFVANDYRIALDRNNDGIVEDSWFNFVYHPLRELDGTFSAVVAVAVDVTSQVAAMRQLERVNRELEEFAFVASHDLQEPMRMIAIYTQLLARELEPFLTETSRGYAAFVNTGVNRMSQLLKDLLNFSHLLHSSADEPGPIATADLNASLAQALLTLQNRISEEGASITAQALPQVRGDQAQLALVFQNLISNALKYRSQNEPARVYITSHQSDSEWTVSVRDNGIGFDQEQAARIFGLFKRLHKHDEYPGTGLGLAICKRIVERYGGRIWADSGVGRGATFSFALPAAS